MCYYSEEQPDEETLLLPRIVLAVVVRDNDERAEVEACSERIGRKVQM